MSECRSARWQTAALTVRTIGTDATLLTVASGYWLEAAGRYPVLHFTKAPNARLGIPHAAGFTILPDDLALASREPVAQTHESRRPNALALAPCGSWRGTSGCGCDGRPAHCPPRAHRDGRTDCFAFPAGLWQGNRCAWRPIRRVHPGALAEGVKVGALSIKRGNAKTAPSAGMGRGSVMGVWDDQPKREIIIAARNRDQGAAFAKTTLNIGRRERATAPCKVPTLRAGQACLGQGAVLSKTVSGLAFKPQRATEAHGPELAKQEQPLTGEGRDAAGEMGAVAVA